MKNYRQLVKELPSKKVVFAFGRFQPPTTGHELLVNAVKKLAGTTADHVIYASKTEDKKSNPLPVARKVYFLKRMFPKTNFLAASAEVRTPIEAAKELNKKYKNIVLVAGSDRVASFQKLLNDYNGKEYHFDTIEVVSAGERDPDSDTASGMSGTKMREAAVAGDFNKFKKGLPHTLTELDGRRLMNDIRKGLGHPVIKESFVVNTNNLREKYINEEIFLIGDKVQDAHGVYEIMDRGTNYVTVADSKGDLSKKWLDQIIESEITEDIQSDCAPKEVSFKGYTTKNLHHSTDATNAFMLTIQRKGGKDPVAVLNALKATDTYMKINDLHLEQGGTAPEKNEINTWIAAHDKAKESLDRIGEFLHHEDYWHMHQHELQDLLTNYKETGKDDMNEELSDKTIKVTDKIKVARIIANTFGVENAEATSDPTQLVNSGLRKVRGKAFNADSLKIIGKMLELAREVGIQYDNNLVPTKLKEGTIQPNKTNEIDVQTSTPTDRTKTVYYKDFKKMIQKEEVVDKKDNESDHDYDARMTANPHSYVGHSMSAPTDSNNLRHQKVRYRLGEEVSEKPAMKHRVAVTVSDPNHTVVSKRKEQVQKFAKVTAGNEKEAINKASAHFKKAGFKIHGAEHHSMVKEDLNELSNDTLGSYKKKAGVEASAADKVGDTKKADKRFSGIIKATKKEFVNDLRKNESYYVGVIDDLTEAMIAIDKGEYDFEGQMARTQLQTTLRNCKDLIAMVKDDDNMPEWVQSKITLAQDYITTVRDYLQSKEELVAESLQPDNDPVFDKDADTELSDDDMDAMINNTQDHEFLDAYDEEELHIIDLDTGEPVEDTEKDIKEETLMEVLSRFERMRAKMRFAKTQSKRNRRMAITLKTRSNSQTINKRARRMAVILMKKRIAKKPLSQLSLGEKERLEKIIQNRKAVIGRIAMKLTPRMRKIEQNRLSHTKGATGSTNNAF